VDRLPTPLLVVALACSEAGFSITSKRKVSVGRSWNIDAVAQSIT